MKWAFRHAMATPPRVDRRLAATLAAGVGGHAHPIERDEARTLQRLRGPRQELGEPSLGDVV